MRLKWMESSQQHRIDAETDEESEILELLVPFLQPRIYSERNFKMPKGKITGLGFPRSNNANQPSSKV